MIYLGNFDLPARSVGKFIVNTAGTNLALPPLAMPFFRSDKYISQFIDVTGLSQAVAKEYQTRYPKNVEIGIQAYFDHQQTSQNPPTQITKKLKEVADTYRDPSKPDRIEIDGTLQYLSDLGVEPEDYRALVLAYLLHLPELGVFEASEFLNVWGSLKKELLTEMREYLDNYSKEIVADVQQFKKMYAYTFGFLMLVPNQKLLKAEDAVEYWKLLFPLIIHGEKSRERLGQWCSFVLEEWKHQVSKDMWIMTLEFFLEVVDDDPETFSKWNEELSYPLVVDLYVEYLRDAGLLPEA